MRTGGFGWRINVTCDEEFVALIRVATALDFAAVFEQQKQRTRRHAEWVDEHANEAEADESEVAVAGAADLEVDVQPFFSLVELAAAKALEDGLADERVCNNCTTANERRQRSGCEGVGNIVHAHIRNITARAILMQRLPILTTSFFTRYTTPTTNSMTGPSKLANMNLVM